MPVEDISIRLVSNTRLETSLQAFEKAIAVSSKAAEEDSSVYSFTLAVIVTFIYILYHTQNRKETAIPPRPIEGRVSLPNCSMKEKEKFCLKIAEKAAAFIDNSDAKTLIEKAIKRGWEWVNNKCDIAEELYNYLDNEENGFTIFQERETNEIIIAAWNSIIDAISFICKSAYLEAGVEYLPEPIELVDDNTIDHMIGAYSWCLDMYLAQKGLRGQEKRQTLKLN